ncbi:MAG TPA: nucleotidyltransferase domain-containing protein [Longimicrobium sp.]|jgi:predicted nucleotidyltransferase|uniref:nucleotidyltransferase domain-containing protein n=1 Tax=Longimicrobium sp. TaxID=2029185 RepID=UPI002EDA2212
MSIIQPTSPRRQEDTLATVLASRALAAVVIYFVLHPDAALHFRALQRVTGVSSQSLQHEMARLEALGLVRRERDGRLVRYRAVADHPRWSVLREMVRQFAGPAELLRVALSEVPGLEAAFIYGSCARGEMDEKSDIDVFALGERLNELEPELALVAGTSEAAVLLGHEVNVTRYTRQKLQQRRGGGFLRSVLAGPKDWLIGDVAVLEPVTGGAV